MNEELKNKFKNGMIPDEVAFAELIDEAGKEVDLSEYVKAEDIPSIEGLLHEDQAAHDYLSKVEADTTYAKTTDIPDTSNFITSEEIPPFPNLDGFATKDEIPNTENFVEESELSTRLSNYVGKLEAEDFARKSDLSGISKSSIPSSRSNFWWSTSKDILETEENQIKTNKMYYKERVLFIGSSTTQGNGAAEREDSYFEILKRKLNDDYEVLVHGIGGDDTNDVINRFYSDVSPFQPDYVVVQLTLGNEGIYQSGTDNTDVYIQFKNNMLKIIRMIHQIGATPIIVNQAATKTFTPEILKYAKQLNKEFDDMGIYQIDWMGNVLGKDGLVIDELMRDGWHYNEEGQKSLANAISPSLFYKVSLPKNNLLPAQDCIRLGSTTDTSTPMQFNFSDTIENFTIFLRVNLNENENVRGLFSLNTQDRITNSNRSISFWNGNTNHNLGVNVFNIGSWHSIAITYHSTTKEFTCFVDGAEVNSLSDIDVNFTEFCLGGRRGSSANTTFRNGRVKDLMIYRSRLDNNQINELHNGKYSSSSLELFSPLEDKNISAGVPLNNLAPTTGNLIVNSEENQITPSQ